MSKMTEFKEAWLRSFPSGEKWLNSLPSVHTQRIFTNYFKIYCDSVKKTPEQLKELKIQGLKLTGENGEFQAEDLLESFLLKSKLKPTAKLMTKNAVFSFYKHNRRPLNSETATNIKNIPLAKSRTPTLEDLSAMEKALATKRDKALLWFMASTSCRVGTVELLLWKDLISTQNPEVPCMLEINADRLKGSGVGKYKGLKQITFLHKYAFDLLQEYKQEAKLKGYVLTEDSPLFIAYYQEDKNICKGLTNKGINQLFDSASLRAFGNLEKKRFSPHDLRSFMQSALESAKVQESLISPIMAHAVKGIAKSYSQHQQQEILENYVSALPYLVPKTVSALETELKTTESKFKNQQQQIEELKGLVTQLLNHEKDMNFSVLQTPKDKQESKEILDKREQQFKKIDPSYTHEPQQKQKIRQRDIDEYKRDGYDR